MKHHGRLGPILLTAALLALLASSCGGSGAARVYLDRAKAFNAEGEELQAAVELGRALGSDPGNREAHLDLGDILFRNGHFNAAEDEYVAALSIKEDLRARYNLGMVALKKRRFRDARVQFEAAARVAPDNYMAHTQLGIVSNQLGKSDAALAAFLVALELRPEDVVARHNAGFGYRIAGRYAEAIEMLEGVIETDPLRTVSLYELGMAHAENDQTEEAREVFNRLLAIDPDHAPATTALEGLDP